MAILTRRANFSGGAEATHEIANSGLSTTTKIVLISIILAVSLIVIAFGIWKFIYVRRERKEKSYMKAPILNSTGMNRDQRRTYDMLYNNNAREDFRAHRQMLPSAYEDRQPPKSSFEQAADGHYLMDGVKRDSAFRPVQTPGRTYGNTVTGV